MTTTILPFATKANKPEQKIQKITPTMAAFILNELNPKNRPLKEGVAERYAADMKAGKWLVTNQGLGFCKEGILIDGQHRLFACVEANVPFETLITVGLDEDAREVIDIGLRRSDADVLALRTGKRVRSAYVGVGRVMFSLRNRKSIGRQDLLDFLQRHEPAIDFALSTSKDKRGITLAQVRAVIARAYYSVDQDKLTRFMGILTTGVYEKDDEHFQPVLMLRDFLLRSVAKRDAASLAELYWKTETALAYYLKGGRISKLYAGTEERFPLGSGKRAQAS